VAVAVPWSLFARGVGRAVAAHHQNRSGAWDATFTWPPDPVQRAELVSDLSMAFLMPVDAGSSAAVVAMTDDVAPVAPSSQHRRQPRRLRAPRTTAMPTASIDDALIRRPT